MCYRKFLLAVFFSMTILLMACTADEPNYESIELENSIYNPKTDYQYYLHQQLYNQRITEAEHGYYMLNGSYIYYMDKETMEPILLDNNPNNDCNPSSVEQQVVNCNAYVELGNMHWGFISYYKDELYVISGSPSKEKDTFNQMQYELIKMQKDGTSRKRVRVFEDIPTTIAIHRDHLYFSDKGENDKGIVVERAVSVPIDAPDSEPTVLYSSEYNDLRYTDIIPYGNQVYITEMGRNMYQTIRYDLEQERWHILYENEEGNAGVTSRINDLLFYSLFTGDARDERSWKAYVSNLTGEEARELPIKFNSLNRIYTDVRYIYLEPNIWYTRDEQYQDLFGDIKDEVLVYDWAYQHVHSIDISIVPRSYNLINGNTDYMFLRTLEGNAEKLYYLDKSQIASKKAQFKLLIETAKYK